MHKRGGHAHAMDDGPCMNVCRGALSSPRTRMCIQCIQTRAGYTGYTRMDTQWIHWIHSGYTPLLSYERFWLKAPDPNRAHAATRACVRGSYLVENQLAGGLQFPTHTVKLKG